MAGITRHRTVHVRERVAEDVTSFASVLYFYYVTRHMGIAALQADV